MLGHLAVATMELRLKKQWQPHNIGVNATGGVHGGGRRKEKLALSSVTMSHHQSPVLFLFIVLGFVIFAHRPIL